jgi:hypothetical protein
VTKTRRRTGAVKGARIPRWITDKQDQKKWNGRFLAILKRDYTNLDASVSAILHDERLSQRCATKIRSYVDKGVTIWWYEQSKARGAKIKEMLKLAIGGLRAAIVLCAIRGDQESASSLGKLAEEFSLQLGRCNQAFATKPHGRDRDHSFLLECHSFLQKELGQPVTYVTLANLVNAGYEADGSSLKEPITEEQIRKNLANFKRNNPLWRLYDSMK